MDLTGTTTVTTKAIIDERPYRIGPTQLTTSAATLYTLPSKKTFKLTHFTISNASSSAVSASVWLVGASGTAADSNAIVNATAIPAYGIMTWDGELYLLTATETIQGKASANSALTFTGGGTEF